MAMSDEDWVNVALSDDSLVVDLLLRLHWSVRFPRSILPPPSSDAAARASPTTPLTWTPTGAAAGATGFFHAPRSENGDKSEVVATMKRARKKKTLGELKEEEVLLLKERRSLEDALATLRLTFEKQRSINGNLKKMKLDYESHRAIDMAATSSIPKEASSEEPQPKMPPRSIRNATPVERLNASYQLPLPNISCKLQEMGKVHVLPDLNLPFQEDSSAEVVYRTS